MSTGPDHYAEAERLLAESRSIAREDLSPAQSLMATLLEGLARAVLALGADLADWEQESGPGVRPVVTLPEPGGPS